MSSNTVRPALRAVHTAGGGSLRPATSQTRCFSASTSRPRVVSFPHASNDELNATLTEIQKKIILPAQLPLHERKKIFRARWKTKLAQRPIELEIDDTKYELKHLNGCAGDVPDTRVILWTAMGQMKTKEDWQILPKVMQALNHARKIDPATWTMLIRKAGEDRNLGAVFDMARRPADHGLKLDSHEKAQKFMTGVVRGVAAAGWTEHAAARGLRDAERVLVLLNDEAHRPRSGHWVRMSRDPAFLAVAMTMAAVLARTHGRVAQYGPRLGEYIDVLLATWPEDAGLLSVYPDAEYLRGGGVHYLMQKSQCLVALAPIIKGFELAQGAVGSGPAAGIASRLARLYEERDSAVNSLVAQEQQGKIKYSLTAGGKMMELCFPKEKSKKKTTAVA